VPAEEMYEVEDRIRMAIRDKKPLPPFILVESDVAYLGSVDWAHEAFSEQSQFGPRVMPPCENPPRKVCEDPEKYPPAILKVFGGFLPLDKGEDQEGNPQQQPMYARAEKIAADYARRFGQHGVFVIASPNGKPTREECKAALAKLEATMK